MIDCLSDRLVPIDKSPTFQGNDGLHTQIVFDVHAVKTDCMGGWKNSPPCIKMGGIEVERLSVQDDFHWRRPQDRLRTLCATLFMKRFVLILSSGTADVVFVFPVLRIA